MFLDFVEVVKGKFGVSLRDVFVFGLVDVVFEILESKDMLVFWRHGGWQLLRSQ